MSSTISKKPEMTEGGLRQKLDGLWAMVGNTPMIAIHYTWKGIPGRVFAKCEHYNLTGSIKDRMALHILERAYVEKRIKPGDRIVEATSGNTGISLAAIGRALGHPVTIIMPDWMSRERKAIIRSLGAEIRTVSKRNGGFLGCIERCLDMADADPDVFLPRQFENGANAEAHRRTTAPEIWNQLGSIGLEPDAFVAGVGTGGTVMGLNQYLKSKNPGVRVHPVEPKESPTLSTGFKRGTHRIQGISAEFIPSIVKLDSLDKIIAVSDGDAIRMAQLMAERLGLAVGISSGANIIAAIQVHAEMGAESVVATVLADSNKKYLSTDLMKEEPVKRGYVSARVELVGYSPVKSRTEKSPV